MNSEPEKMPEIETDKINKELKNNINWIDDASPE